MKARLSLCLLILILTVTCLLSENISFVSRSLPSLGKPGDFCRYGDYGLFVGSYNPSAVGGSHHLAIVDFDASYAVPVAVYDVTGNGYPSSKVHCYGDYAYLFVYESMYVISLQDILHPVMVREIDLNATRRASLIQGNILYIANSLGTLTSYSLANPAFPVNMNTITIPGITYDNMYAGDGFIACQSDSIYIVDTNNPQNMKRSASLAHVDSQPELSNSQCVAFGDYLICNTLNELKVYNLANPYAPVLSGSIVLDCSDLIYKAEINDNVLWSLYYEGNWEDNVIGIMAIDLSNPVTPVQTLKQSIIEDWNPAECYEFMRIAGNRAVFFQPVSYMQSALLSGSDFTMSDILIPYGSIGKLAASTDWIVGQNLRLNILDYKSDKILYPSLQIEPESYYYDTMQISGDLLLCAYSFRSDATMYDDYDPTLNIYDLITGDKLCRYPLPYNEWGEYPTLPKSISVYGNLAYLCNGTGGLLCLDISDPENPTQRFRLRNPGWNVLSAVVHGNMLWLGSNFISSGGYLDVYDISDIDNPINVNTIDIGIDYYKPAMYCKGDYLYLLFNGYLKCFRMEGSEIAEQTQIQLYGYGVSTLLPISEGLFAGGDRQMWILSLKDPLHPVQTGFQLLDAAYPNYYPDCQYAVQGYKVLVSNGYDLKCYDATQAALMCSNDLEPDNGELRVFPNPGKDVVYAAFKSSEAGAGKIRIFNLRGQEVSHKDISSISEGLNAQELPLTNRSGTKLSSGVYLIQVVTPTQKLTSRMIISR